MADSDPIDIVCRLDADDWAESNPLKVEAREEIKSLREEYGQLAVAALREMGGSYVHEKIREHDYGSFNDGCLGCLVKRARAALPTPEPGDA